MNFLDMVLAFIAVVGVAWMAAVLLVCRRQFRTPTHVLIVGVIDGICGLTCLILGTGHLIAVAERVFRRATSLGSYNFRAYSLLLIGLLISASGLFCLVHLHGLLKGSRLAWNNSLWASVLLLIINAPLAPLQRFAVLLTALSVTNIIALAAAYGSFSKLR
jgi:hypothetical protein